MSANSLKNKLVFITGASSGIGAACAHLFAKQGAKLLLCARNLERLEKVARPLRDKYSVDIHTFELDVAQRDVVAQRIKALPAAWQQVDILVNNAGMALGLEHLQEGNVTDWDATIDTNVKGLLYVTRAFLSMMVERNSGHIINIGSIAGHELYPKGIVYCATKHAVRALSNGLRIDLFGTKIRVSSVDPGAVRTNFSEVRFKGDKARAEAIYEGFQPLQAEDVADAVVYCASCPPHVNISEIIIMPTDQACATMINRKRDNH
jgi:3-hydroxy acid dehydrogenase/malonic semialdehyde reductase